MKLLKFFKLILLTLLLSACGSGEVLRVNPPTVSLHRAYAKIGEPLQLDVRIHNQSDVAMQLESVKIRVGIGDIDLGDYTSPNGLSVLPHRGEVLTMTAATSNPAQIAAIKTLRAEAANMITYTIAGTIVFSEPKRRYPIEFSSRLSPIPGKDGEFR